LIFLDKLPHDFETQWSNNRKNKSADCNDFVKWNVRHARHAAHQLVQMVLTGTEAWIAAQKIWN